MKLKIVSDSLRGSHAEIWIDGELTVDVTSLTLNLDPRRPTTATITRLVDELAVGVEVADR